MSGTEEPTPVGTGPALVPVAEAARHFGITERAVRKRIVAGTLHGVMIDRAWHMSSTGPSGEPEQGRSSAGSRNRNSSGPVPLAPVPVQTQMNVLMQEWIAPLAARIEALAGENGELRADRRHEQERREAIERERDELRARLAAAEDRNSCLCKALPSLLGAYNANRRYSRSSGGPGGCGSSAGGSNATSGS